jgi:GntR family transcriptional repressor for pyruvate dehydrogenase complex
VTHLPQRSFRRGRLSEQVVLELERMLAEEFPTPGDRLPKESELAERFHVSRIVVREAIKVLEDRGALEVRAGSGTYTLAPSIEKVKESLKRLFKDHPFPAQSDAELMLELRGVLEESVAGLAAVRATPEDLETMDAALVEMEAGHDDEGTAEADLRFHLAVARAAHNPYFEMVIDPLTSVFIQQIRLTNSYTVGVDLHRSVAEEIRNGNPVGARQAVRRLMRNTLEYSRKAIRLMESASGVHAEQESGAFK